MLKKVKVTFTLYLVIAMIISTLPLGAFAEESNQPSKQEDTKLEPLSEGKEYEVLEDVKGDYSDLQPGEEIVEERTENSKVFYSGENAITENVYFEPIHRIDEDSGELMEISSELVEDSGNENEIETENTTLLSAFQKKMEHGEYATFEVDGHTITYSILEASKNGEFSIPSSNVEAVYEENRIVHKSIFPDIDLRNISFDNETKEDLILQSYQGYNTFTFKLDTDLKAERTQNGEIKFVDEKDKEIFLIPKPYMEDSNYDDHKGENVKSEDIEIELDQISEGYILTLIADDKWLADPDRVYPVYIDPSTSLGTTQDTFVMSKYPTTNYNSGKWDSSQGQYVLKIGEYDSTTGMNYAFLKPQTDGLTPEKGYMVDKATLHLYVTHAYYANSPNGLWIDRVNGNWSASTLTWNNKPSSSNITSVNVGRDQWATVDVTSVVKEWNKGTKTNYGFKLHTNGHKQTHWKKVVSASNSNYKPYVSVTYTTLGNASTPTVKGYSNGKNTGTGYFDLTWNKVTGATGYKVGIFNGKEYQYFDVKNTTSWTTKGKKLWPTKSEIDLGNYGLHRDGKGTEFPNDPNSTYVASGGNYQDRHYYYFRVVAYNDDFNVETPSSNPATPTLPDSTSPAVPTTPTVTIQNGPLNGGDSATAIVSWKGVEDFPKVINTGTSHYEVQKSINGSWTSVGTVSHTGESKHHITIQNLPDTTTVAFRVRAIDKKGNESGYATSSDYVTKDRTRPNTPASVSVSPSGWSNSQQYTLTWTGLTDNQSIQTIEYKVDDQDWKSLGVNSSSGSSKLPVDIEDGIHTVSLRGKDREGNTGPSKSVTISKDTKAPLVSFMSPIENNTVQGIEDITIHVTNTPPTSVEKNLLSNGDFSAGIEGWKEARSRENGKVTVIDGSGELKDVLVLQLLPMSSSPGAEFGHLSSTYNVKVKPNTTYTLKGKIKTNLKEANAFFNVQSIDKNGDRIRWDDSRDRQLSGVQSWTDHDLTFTTPSNVDRVKIYLEVDHSSNRAQGYAWFDNISLTEQGKSSVNLISNGDFSSELEGWNIEKQNNIGTSKVVEDPTVLEIKDGEIETNTLKMETESTSPGSELGYLVVTQEIEVKPSTTYRVQGKIKTNLSESNAYFNTKSVTKDGTTIQWMSSKNKQLTGTNGWTDHELLFTTPENASKVVVYLEIDHYSPNGRGTAWFDSIRFEEVKQPTLEGAFLWDLSYGEGENPVEYIQLSKGTTSQNEVSYAWNTSDLQEEKDYTLRFTATDEAGNTAEKKAIVIKAKDTTSIKPTISITNPKNTETVKDPDQKIEYTNGTIGQFEALDVFINSTPIPSNNTTELKFDASNYSEGSKNQLFLRGKDKNGEFHYSTYSYRTLGIVDDFEGEQHIHSRSNVTVVDNKIKLIDPTKVGSIQSNMDPVSGLISTVHLATKQEVPSGTSIKYEASVDGGNTWELIYPSKVNALSRVGSSLQLRATLIPSSNGVSPQIDSWESEVIYVNKQGNSFNVQLIDVPNNLTATPNVNYMTHLRWNASITQGVTYSVYRSSSPSFTPSEQTLVAKDVKDPYWDDFNLHYGQKFYYRVVAEKEMNGKVRQSLASNEAYAKVVDKDELEKRLGLQDYWGYSSFPTAQGDGYINISSGNLVYQSTDFVSLSPQLAMVMRRTFNSQSTTKTPLGYGWDFSLNTTLMKEYDGQGQEIGLILKDGDGSLHRFKKKSEGGYETPKGIHMTLTQKEDGTFEILRKDQIRYVFDQRMKLVKLTEPNDNALTFVYDSLKGNLKIVLNNMGDKTYLFYDTSDRLERVVDPGGREYHFEYNESSDQLSKVKQTIVDKEFAEEYKYDEGKNEFIIVDPERYETKVAYHVDGKVKTVTDPIGQFSTFDYKNEMTTITSDKGKKYTYTYNPNGNVVSKMYPDQHTIHYEYDENMLVKHLYYNNLINGTVKTLHHYFTYDQRGNILTTTDPLGNITQYKNYNAMNLVGEIVEPVREGVVANSKYTYDNKGNVKTYTDPQNRTVSYTYDHYGNRTSVTNEFGQTTRYEYYSSGTNKGKLHKIIEPLGKITEIKEYDSQGNAIEIKDPRGYITKNKYDLLDRLVTTTDEKGYSISREYDFNHNLTTITDNKGNLTQYKYDEVGRLSKTTYPDNSIEEIFYDFDENQNEKITYKDGEGHTSTEYYNEVGQLEKQESFNSITTFKYDHVGNMTQVIDGEGREVQSIYDELNRQKQVIVDPSGKKIVSTNEYDLSGNVIKTIDGKGYSTSFEYDLLNRLKKVSKVVDGQTLVTQYQYDIKEGDWVKNKVIDALGREKVTYLDALGQVRKEITEGNTSDAIKMKTEFAYDLNGNLKETTHNDGTIVKQVYDSRNMLEKITYNTNHWTRFEYDENGNRELMEDYKNGMVTTSTYAYDKKNRLKEEIQNGLPISYRYDNSDNVTHIYYPIEEGDKQKDIEYIYDEYDRLESIVVEGKKAQEYEYNQAAQVDFINNFVEFDTGGDSFVKVDYTYNSLGQTETIEYLKQGNTKIEEYQLLYDPRGYIDTEKVFSHYGEAEKTVHKTYKYNEAGQLKESKIDNKITTYTYDGVGNRTSMKEGNDSYVYTFNQFNQLERTTKNGASHASYEYDTRGNQRKEIIKKEIDNVFKEVTTEYAFDDANQLTQVKTITPGQDTTILKNWYNGDGQRVRRDADGIITNYVYDEHALLYTADINNQKVTENILNPTGDIVASKRFDGNYKNQYFFYHYDLRGSVTNIIDSDIKRVKGYEYDDFGNNQEVGDKTFKNDVKFTGAVHDSSTGLHYMNSRYYSSETGRFISQDTYSGNAFDPWTQHLYTYTTNNPVNFVDPTGHYHVDPDGNKVLGSGQVIKNPSQPGPSNYGTPSGVSKSKPSTKKTSGGSVKKLIQTGLDYGGYIPGPLGAVADGVNALIYLADGDYKNAALSGMAVLPGGSAAKSGIKAGGALGSVAKGTGKSKWWHTGYVDDLSPTQTILGVKNGSPKGLSTLGSSTRQSALDAGKAWVGKGGEEMYDKAGNFIGYKSEDKMRAFRLQYKSKEKMWRANFTENEITINGSKTELRNVHVDILD